MNVIKKLFLIWTAVVVLASCSFFQKPVEPQSNSLPSAPTADSPSGLPSTEPTKNYQDRKKITLVLGGAGVASFATVGILKRLHEEGIIVENLITSGWPSLFALARGFLGSIHDVEWFAMRLDEKDFAKLSNFDFAKKDAEEEKVTQLIESNFKRKELVDSKIPILISTTNNLGSEGESYNRGEWKTPLLRTMSVPGLFRRYPSIESSGVHSAVKAIDVELALRNEHKTIVAVEMYGDYFDFLEKGKKDSTSGDFRKSHLSSLKNSLNQQLKEAALVGRIELQSSPTNFSQKRLAMLKGYKEGARLAKLIKKLE